MSSHRDPELDSPGTFSIEADRLILRDFAPDDLPAVHAFRSDPETIRFMSDQPEPATLAQSSEWLDGAIRYNALRPREGYNLAIATKTPDRVIGWIGFGSSSRHPGPEHFGVGYMLLSTEWGKGHATEALTAAIAFMTDTLGGRSGPAPPGKPPSTTPPASVREPPAPPSPHGRSASRSQPPPRSSSH